MSLCLAQLIERGIGLLLQGGKIDRCGDGMPLRRLYRPGRQDG